MSKQIIQLSRSKDFLVVTESKFDSDGFATSTRRAIIALDPTKNKQVMLEKARKFHWHMSEELDANGFAIATRGDALPEGEAASVGGDVEQEG